MLGEASVDVEGGYVFLEVKVTADPFTVEIGTATVAAAVSYSPLR